MNEVKCGSEFVVKVVDVLAVTLRCSMPPDHEGMHAAVVGWEREEDPLTVDDVPEWGFTDDEAAGQRQP